MKKDLNIRWLYDQAADDKSRQWIERIIQWRDSVYENNIFMGDDSLFSVVLDKNRVWFRKCSSFSSIEVYHEIFEEKNHFLVPEFSGREEAVVVDIGANEGFYVLKVKEHNPGCRVICAEPNPYLFEILTKNIESNHLENVVLVNKAIDLSNGTVPFEIVKEIGAIGGKSLKIVERPWLKEEFIERINVEIVTFKALCEEYEIAHIGILKIDVEGMEMNVLQGCGCLLSKVDKIVIERHSRRLRDEIVTFLTDNNFYLVYEEDAGFERYYGDLYFKNKSN